MDKEVDELLHALGYAQSENCLSGEAMASAPDFGHLFRRASGDDSAGLQAVYCLQEPQSGGQISAPRPVTYVCKASTKKQADEIHRLVWNQNTVPLVVVLTQSEVRLYSAFDWKVGSKPLAIADTIHQVTDKLATVTAAAIDTGDVWRHHAADLDPAKRVEWRLLKNLQDLESILREEGVENRSVAHALIGKFVYLYYLRHRNILSDKLLSEWQLSWSEVSGSTIQVGKFEVLCDKVDSFLNGTVFPIAKSTLRKVGTTILKKVAGIFSGDSSKGQKYLSFSHYDFSFIPIETLSVIYEQFLQTKPGKGGRSVGRNQGAYYTPIPVVNFMIDRMDEIVPLRKGTRVLDPACGSGAFLVQCFRKLAEDRLRDGSKRRGIRPNEIKQLLVDHIHGIDVDEEACRVAELSLNLTLLDYINPPDLLDRRLEEFQLPGLYGTNIVCSDAFSDESRYRRWIDRGGFEWVVGNPPWKPLQLSNSKDKGHGPLLKWLESNKQDKPVGWKQAAEAFLWRATEFAARKSIAGMLIPSMTLFKDVSTAFRAAFFGKHKAEYVANFSNMAEVLFARRSREPSAAVIFRPNMANAPTDSDRQVAVFSPLVANQEPTRPREAGKRVASWTIVMDAGEVQYVSNSDIVSGSAAPFVFAAWGSSLDQRIMRKLQRLATLATWEDKYKLLISEGLKVQSGGKEAERHSELAGKLALNAKSLSTARRLFSLPTYALRTLDKDEVYVPSQSGFQRKEAACNPPHIIVSAARNWAVFESRYVVAIGQHVIASAQSLHGPLKALAMYLNSDVAQYHQFFASPQAGVKRPRYPLESLRTLPLPEPLSTVNPRVIKEWGEVYDQLEAIDSAASAVGGARRRPLLDKLNRQVNQHMGLSELELKRIDEFVNVIDGLKDGKVEERAVRRPEDSEVKAYGTALKLELDGFVYEEGSRQGHNVELFLGDTLGVIRVTQGANRSGVVVHSRDNAASVVVEKSDGLREELASRYAQWRYFNRSLRLFVDDAMYLFKPMQRFHWLQSQAVVDATEIIGLAVEQAGATE
ncbi:MAG: N-6 DNA methylase [Planctomycetes bacterium]|nr:N-6 DNA methylase [Planctomycetota bacterium]MCW8135918.1 N-6 DNA methylase [Planctomycetota bacterium]